MALTALRRRVPELHGRRVLVTGDTGFKGSWLVTVLEAAGATVTGFALAPETRPSLHELLGRAAPPWGYGDVRDAAALRRALEGARPEVVLHLAAQPLVRRSYADPHGTFAANVQGTVNLLEEVRRRPEVGAIVIVTSDKCYRNDGRGRPFAEEDPLGGSDPYSASKAAAEIVAASYRESFFAGADPPVGLATARAGNVLGGGDWSPDRLLPDILRAHAARQPVALRHPDAVRPWQHVLDVCIGYALLAAAVLRNPRRFSRPWNFAPPVPRRPLAVSCVVELALEALGSDIGWAPVAERGRRLGEAPTLRLNAARARRQLGWRSVLDAAEAVRWTVDWHRRLAAGAPAAAICADQLALFVKRLRANG